jgi:hypothetical protein
MLEKTLAMLNGIKPGTYLPDDTKCFDPAEIDVLGRLLQRLIYAPSSLRRELQEKYRVTLTRADFYSEIPTIAELERSFVKPSLLKLDEIFPDNRVMLAELDRLIPAAREFDPPRQSDRPDEYAWERKPFSFSDAMAYYAMIRTRKPQTIIEIGSGWSTLIAQMACARNGTGRIICVEPYPMPFLEARPGIELVRKRAQEVETSFFNDLIRDGDMLFIDSTHTVKHDSDCLHIYLRILPNIKASIVVHVHDIYLPDPFPLERMRNEQIFWNEQYLVYSYLLGNSRTQAIFGSRYNLHRNRDALERLMHGRFPSGGASFWFNQERL